MDLQAFCASCRWLTSKGQGPVRKGFVFSLAAPGRSSVYSGGSGSSNTPLLISGDGSLSGFQGLAWIESGRAKSKSRLVRMLHGWPETTRSGAKESIDAAAFLSHPECHCLQRLLVWRSDVVARS